MCVQHRLPEETEAAANLVSDFARLVGTCHAADPSTMDEFWSILIGSILLDASIHVQPVLFTCLALAPWHQWVVQLEQLSEVRFRVVLSQFVYNSEVCMLHAGVVVLMLY